MVEISTVFCLCKKKQIKEMQNNRKEITFFCKDYDPSFVDEKYILLAEDNSIFLDLFENRNLLGFYKKIEEFVNSIYYSDRNDTNQYNINIFNHNNINNINNFNILIVIII